MTLNPFRPFGPEIREQGRHDELLRQRGIYYRLSQLQYSEGDAMNSP